MILAFGGGGQLGRNLAHAAAEKGISLTALSRSETDICDAGVVARSIRAARAALVVNAAAYTNVDLAETEVSAAERANADGPGTVAAACKAAGIPLVHVSTDYVFDGRKQGAYAEGDPVAPLGVYGRTKAAGEGAVREALVQHVILRSSWIYGEHGKNFLRTTVQRAQERDELSVVADQRGCPTSARELARSILRIAPRLIAGDGVWGTYHFAGTGVTSWHGFAERIVAAQAPLTGRRPRVLAITTAEYPTPARRPANSVLDCGRFARVFGFRARPWTEEVDEVTAAVVTALERSEPHHVA